MRTFVHGFDVYIWNVEQYVVVHGGRRWRVSPMGYPYDRVNYARAQGWRIKQRRSNRWNCNEIHILLPQEEADKYTVRYVDEAMMPLVESVPINILTRDGYVCEISRIERAESSQDEGIAYGVFGIGICRHDGDTYRWKLGHILNPETRIWFEDSGFINEVTKERLAYRDPRMDAYLDLLLQTGDVGTSFNAVFGEHSMAIEKGKDLIRRPEIRALMTEKLDDKLAVVLRERGLNPDTKRWVIDQYVEVILGEDTANKDKLSALSEISDMIGLRPKKEIVPMPTIGILPQEELDEMRDIAAAHKNREITDGDRYTELAAAQGTDEDRPGDDRPRMPSEDIQSELPEIS